ncbi:hypothetical protein BEWA_032890 [Theileria equi strain WA]|uniref:Uncharacterized protein n=1 Tax=Theileria equi strain WA TaxID=1537102 RepID=L0AZL8_THEEQ|nr:hypothetical protein BEWA_032890 [Theileria equi strain WA]AFZ80436.1 hypothetical protein BEWA_032890 [Theileria equi strain WA]|eukprot:XP_004830102.1 hypothetical protein BEWA_032890 [Theileria equi strain WA]
MDRSHFFNIVFDGGAQVWKAGTDHEECHSVEHYVRLLFPELLVLNILRRTGFDHLYFGKVDGEWTEISKSKFNVILTKMKYTDTFDPESVLQKEKKRCPVNYPLVVLDISEPDASKFYINENQHGQVSHVQYIGNVGEYITAVVDEVDEIWIGGPRERCAVVASYTRGEDALITLWIVKTRLEVLRFKKINGKWKSIPWEEFNVELTRMMKNRRSQEPVVSYSASDESLQNIHNENLRGTSQRIVTCRRYSFQDSFSQRNYWHLIDKHESYGSDSGEEERRYITLNLANAKSGPFSIYEDIIGDTFCRSYSVSNVYCIDRVIYGDELLWNRQENTNCKGVHSYSYNGETVFKLNIHKGNVLCPRYFRRRDSRFTEVSEDEYNICSGNGDEEVSIEEPQSLVSVDLACEHPSSFTFLEQNVIDGYPYNKYAPPLTYFFNVIRDNGNEVWRASGNEKCLCAYSCSVNGTTRLILEILGDEEAFFKFFEKGGRTWNEIEYEESSTETLSEPNRPTLDGAGCSKWNSF